ETSDMPQGPAKDHAGKQPGESLTVTPPENQRSMDGSQAQATAPGAEQKSKDAVGSQPREQLRTDQAQKAPPPADNDPLREQMLKVNWKTDLSGGIQRIAISHGMAPYGNGKARCFVWNFPDPVPKHREPLYTARRDLLPEYATYADRKLWRLPQLYASIQSRDVSGEYPLVLTSGRLVE